MALPYSIMESLYPSPSPSIISSDLMWWQRTNVMIVVANSECNEPMTFDHWTRYQRCLLNFMVIVTGLFIFPFPFPLTIATYGSYQPFVYLLFSSLKDSSFTYFCHCTISAVRGWNLTATDGLYWEKNLNNSCGIHATKNHLIISNPVG